MTCGHDLENRAGQTRSIYGPRGHAPKRDDGYLAGRDKHTMSEPKTADGLHPSYVATWPDIEAPHTPFASLVK